MKVQKMTQAEANDYIQEVAKRFLKETYNLYLFIPIIIEDLNSNQVGKFNINIYSKNNIIYREIPRNISISKLAFEFVNDEVLEHIIKHECVHYALFNLKKPYQDEDEYFQTELKRLGIKSFISKDEFKEKYKYTCQNCGYSFISKLDLDPKYIEHKECEIYINNNIKTGSLLKEKIMGEKRRIIC